MRLVLLDIVHSKDIRRNVWLALVGDSILSGQILVLVHTYLLINYHNHRLNPIDHC